MNVSYKEFDAAEYLTDEETIQYYLEAALQGGDMEHFMSALGDVAKARGMTHVAQAANVNRESLYKTFAPGTKPRFDTVQKVLAALNLRFSVVPVVKHHP